MGEKKPVRGLNWDKGAIGTAKWGGVRLRDVLVYAGLDPEYGDGMGWVRCYRKVKMVWAGMRCCRKM